MNQPSIKLCCCKKGCPEVSILSNKRLKIRDDYGNVVVMSTDEAKLLGPAIDKLLK